MRCRRGKINICDDRGGCRLYGVEDEWIIPFLRAGARAVGCGSDALLEDCPRKTI